MNVEEFKHIIGAAAAVSNNNYFLIFGSQAPLGHMLDQNDNYEFWVSR